MLTRTRPAWRAVVTAALVSLALSTAVDLRAAELPPARSGRVEAAPGAWNGSWTGPGWRWRRVRVGGTGGEGALLAVSADPLRPGRVAVAHLEGVSMREPEGGFRFAARVEGVTDLAFARDGSLWIGSLSGLWQLTPEARLIDRSPAPGDAPRRVSRLAVQADVIVACTEAGAFVARASGESASPLRWTRLADGLPRGPVRAARPAAAAEEASAWLVLLGRELWHVSLAWRDGRGAVAAAQRVAVAGAPTGELPRDLATGMAGGEIVLLYPRSLAVRGPGERFRILRPVLPPGAVATRIASGGGRVWIATDHGLLHAPAWEGPWRRSEAPAGSAAVLGLAETAGGDGLLAASPTGLLEGAPVLRAAPSRAPSTVVEARSDSLPHFVAASDPDIRSVQAASLRYLGLRPERMHELRAGLAVRGWIPALSLRVAAARDRAWSRDYDESFLSGDTRYLRDRDKDKTLDLEASVVMTWALGAIAFDEDAIDLSREHRQVVSLRDNVLDEINQLYFERRGLLDKLRAPGAAADPESARMALRAAELAAGLDAWTGGWFSSQIARAQLTPNEGPDSLEDRP